MNNVKLSGIYSDRIYRIYKILIFYIFSFRKKLKIHNRLRRIKMEIIHTNLSKLSQTVIKNHCIASN